MDGVVYHFMDLVQGVFDIVMVGMMFHMMLRQQAYEIVINMDDKKLDKIEAQVKALVKKSKPAKKIGFNVS